jgi:hypothetical protein
MSKAIGVVEPLAMFAVVVSTARNAEGVREPNVGVVSCP